MKIGKYNFDTYHNTYIMGILNVTPDSFSDGGKYSTLDQALLHAEQMVRDGAHIIDVGGESTRPGYEEIPAGEEIERVAPVIEALKKNLDVPVSIDTYKSPVAEAAFQAGADMVNDIWGFMADPAMPGLCAKYDAACCLMHNKKEPVYRDFLPEMLYELGRCVERAIAFGVDPDKIMVDPGIGFGKTQEQNLEMIAHLEIMRELGYPALLGTSRKSVIGNVLELSADERLEGTLVTTVYAVQQGCSFVRVHDVKENARAIRMTRALLQVDRRR